MTARANSVYIDQTAPYCLPKLHMQTSMASNNGLLEVSSPYDRCVGGMITPDSLSCSFCTEREHISLILQSFIRMAYDKNIKLRFSWPSLEVHLNFPYISYT